MAIKQNNALVTDSGIRLMIEGLYDMFYLGLLGIIIYGVISPVTTVILYPIIEYPSGPVVFVEWLVFAMRTLFLTVISHQAEWSGISKVETKYRGNFVSSVIGTSLIMYPGLFYYFPNLTRIVGPLIILFHVVRALHLQGVDVYLSNIHHPIDRPNDEWILMGESSGGSPEGSQSVKSE